MNKWKHVESSMALFVVRERREGQRSLELFRMPESEAVRIGLGIILQTVDQPKEGREGIWTVRHVTGADYGTRCEFSDGSWMTVYREWIPEKHAYRYWAED